MLSDKIVVRNLLEICAAKGLEYVIISPGSRNAPLNISFNEDGRFKCLSVPDERVAAFVALGIAQQTGKPAIITCTSGSAALNYAPAISEAFYQQIPMFIITADRPAEWTDQGDGQTIRQSHLYANYVKRSYDLPQDAPTPDDLWHINRTISEAIDQTTHYGVPAPVHLNLPFREPLYRKRDYTGVPLPKISQTVSTEPALQPTDIAAVIKNWTGFEKILILTGVLPPHPALNDLLGKISEQFPSVVVLTETTSNLHHPHFFPCIDRLIDNIPAEAMPDFRPDLLVTIGHSVISKKIKALLRKQPPQQHWHIGKEDFHLDTYQVLTHHFPILPATFFAQIRSESVFQPIQNSENSYFNTWKNWDEITTARHEIFMQTCLWSDLKAFQWILKTLPEGCNLQMGNSSPVRYVQLFRQRTDVVHNANRGVAGIDGCTSTAVGAALVNQRPTVVVTGDIGFLYDSNAFWNFHLTDNLRVIVINNGGGGIFRIIPGPDTTDQLEDFFEAHHDLNTEPIARLFNLNYYFADSEESLTKNLSLFFEKQPNQRPAILEIKTPRLANDKVLKAYFEFLKF